MRIPNLQRDPNQQSLINNAYSKLSNIAQELNCSTNEENSTEIQFISFEQALKELLELKKNSS